MAGERCAGFAQLKAVAHGRQLVVDDRYGAQWAACGDLICLPPAIKI
jgi:hypothetical protein